MNSAIKSKKVCKTIIFLGTSEVGKTNILQRFTKRRFEESYIETIGVDYYSKNVTNDYGNITLSMWDTSGTEMEYKILPQNVYKIASCYVIVCSYDIRNSFEMIHSWLKHVQLYLNKSGNANPTLPIIILINKLDIKKDKRTFKIRDIIKIIDENNLNIMLYEVSAKENVKLDLVFEKIVGLLTGALSFANEANSLNRTVIEELISNKDLNSTEMINRRRSFQLQGQVRSEVTTDKMAKANKSCC